MYYYQARKKKKNALNTPALTTKCGHYTTDCGGGAKILQSCFKKTAKKEKKFTAPHLLIYKLNFIY